MSINEQRMALLRSPKALVATRYIAGEMGGSTIHCVVLADGFILECGAGMDAEERAVLLAETINAASPEAFNFRSLK